MLLPIKTECGTITFTNSDTILQLNTVGQAVQLKLGIGDNNVLESSSFAQVFYTEQGIKKTADSNSLDCIYEGNQGKLNVGFPGGINAIICCQIEPDHFVFTVEAVTPSVLALAFLQIILTCDAYGGMMPALLVGDYLVAQVPLNAESHVHSTQMSNQANQYALISAGFSSLKLMGTKTALVVCHHDQWHDRMKALAEKYQLPYPTIQGVWDKKHPALKSSYLFADFDINNHIQLIDYAKKGRIGYVMPYSWTWSPHNTGSYNNLNAAERADLQMISQNIHAAYLKLGLHVKAFMVDPYDPIIQSSWVSKLAKNPMPLRLATPINKTDYILPLANPEQLSDFHSLGGAYLLVGAEILLLESIQETPPALIVSNTNGSRVSHFGTIPAAYSINTLMYRLVESFECFMADPKTDLPDYIAQQFASVYKTLGADFAFLDGAEVTRVLQPYAPWSDGWYWLASAQVADCYRSALAGEDVLLESSSMNENLGYSWFALSRGNSGDFATYAVEAWMDHYRLGRYYHKMYQPVAMPQELGWIGLLAKRNDGNNSYKPLNASFASTTLDEIEYQMNRSLGFGIPISFETDFQSIQANKEADKIFTLIGKYEHLRLNFQLPDALKVKLQGKEASLAHLDSHLKTQYRLVSLQVNTCTFRKQVYLERVMSSGEKWTFENPLHGQTLKVKITALPGHGKTTDQDTRTLFDAMNSTFFGVIDRGLGVKADDQEAGKPNVYIKDGKIKVDKIDPSYLLQHRWCGFRMEFENSMNLSEHKVISLLAEGTASGAVVCLQLFDAQGTPYHRLFQFKMDFVNSKQFIFERPTAAAFYEAAPQINGGSLFRYFKWSQVKGVEIYIKHISSPISIKISEVKALNQIYSTLNNPVLQLGVQKLSFNAQLSPYHAELGAEPWDYLVYEGGFNYNCYDGNHKKLNGFPKMVPSFGLPFVKSGTNTLTYQHKGENKAVVQLLLEGKNEIYIEDGNSND